MNQMWNADMASAGGTPSERKLQQHQNQIVELCFPWFPHSIANVELQCATLSEFGLFLPCRGWTAQQIVPRGHQSPPFESFL